MGQQKNSVGDAGGDDITDVLEYDTKIVLFHLMEKACEFAECAPCVALGERKDG